ncbi:MAG TPA: hypothetical protein VJ953_12075 [Saprospiraceae bacterium]|nr:hypothetical protein [Saprospiraceae bacterium]
MHHHPILILLAALLLSGTACQRQPSAPEEDRWMGAAKAEAIRYTSVAKAYHIAPGKMAGGKTNQHFQGYPILSGPIELDPEERQQITSLLSDTSSYQLDEAFKMCLFTPNVALLLEREGQASLEVLLCLDCNVLKIYERGQEIFSEDFDPSRSAFLTIFYPLFKEMPYFQSLKST